MSEFEQILLFIICSTPNFVCIFDLALKFNKNISRAIFGILSTYILPIAVIPSSCILCLLEFQIWYHRCTKHVPYCLSIILIILSNDVHINPGHQVQNIYLVGCQSYLLYYLMTFI